MPTTPYPVDPQLTGLAIAYKNTAYIADEIAPYRTVNKREYEWDNYTIADMYTVPDTKVGRLSQPNQVTFSASRETSSCVDYALDAPVPQEDIDNSDAHINPLGHATEGVMELVKLDRELRVRDFTFNLNSYLASQRATLSGTSQWSDYTNSDPKSVIMSALDSCLIRPNALVFGRAGWTIFRQHPRIVRALRATDSGEGVVNAADVASLLEIDRIIIGTSWQNVNKIGQPFSKARIWGKNVAALYLNSSAQLTGTVTAPTFAITARFGTPVSGSIQDPDVGMKGGVRVRAGESVKEQLVANQGAFYWQNAFA